MSTNARPNDQALEVVEGLDWKALGLGTMAPRLPNLSGTQDPGHAAPNADPSETTLENFDEEDEEVSKKTSQATLLVRFAEQRVELFHDENQVAYGFDLESHETRRLEGRQFRDWLVAGYYRDMEVSPRDQSVREAIGTLAGVARRDGPCRQVHVRVAHFEGVYFLDLGESRQGRAVKIHPGTWRVVTDPPVRFLRPESLQPLTVPQPGGDLTELWSLVNVPIAPTNGDKRFIGGARKSGLFSPIGWHPGDKLAELLVAEGWATGAAIHLMNGSPLVCGTDAGNLLATAQTIRTRWPRLPLVFCADHDGPGGGIGTDKAKAAALAIGNARVIRPQCADHEHIDFADVWVQQQRRAA